jgi:hypothetical protein
MGVEAAIIGGSLLGGAASIFSGNRAAKAQTKAANLAAETQRANFLDGLAVIQPQIDAGNEARRALSYEYGLGERPTFMSDPYVAPTYDIQTIKGGPQYERREEDGTGYNALTGYGINKYVVNGQEFLNESAAQQHVNALMAADQANAPSQGEFEYRGFEATPSYQFNMDEGQKAIDRAMAARGLSGSGATMKNASRYAQGLASQEYNNFLGGLSAMASGGQYAANNAFTGYQNQGAALGNYQLQAGNARASAHMNTGNSINNMIGGALGAFGYGG